MHCSNSIRERKKDWYDHSRETRYSVPGTQFFFELQDHPENNQIRHLLMAAI